MIELLIFADDFTGALDAGAQLSTSGINTIVLDHSRFIDYFDNEGAADGSASEMEGSRPAVIVINTESRHIHPDAAYRRLRALTAASSGLAPRFIYKKTDSVLRGNIGAELKGMIDGAEAHTVIFVPAYPEQERTTINGKQYIKGLPIEKSEFSSDPRTPVQTNDIGAIIRSQADLYCRHIAKRSSDSAALRSAHSGLPMSAAAGAEKTTSERKEVLIVDGESRADLDETAEALTCISDLRCLAGCAGFLASLPKLLRTPRTQMSLPALRTPVLVAAGSVHPASISQVEAAADAGCHVLSFPSAAQKQEAFSSSAEAREMKLQAEKILKRHNVLIARSLAAGETKGVLKESDVSLLLQNMGAFFADLIVAQEIKTLVVFGGDTLASILEHFNFPPITPLGEIEAGVVQARLSLENRSISLISKPGGYGHDKTLVHIINRVI
jgi:uncharacterized protein YgbK (DUF1537 family)